MTGAPIVAKKRGLMKGIVNGERAGIGDYSHIGTGQRFCDPEEEFPKRAESKKWLGK